MSVREDLLRLQRWRLDERQSYLADLEALAERLRGDVGRLAAEIADGRRLRPGVAPLFHAPLTERRDKIERSIAELDAQIAEARAVVAAATAEVEHAAAALRPRGEAVRGEAEAATGFVYRRRRARRAGGRGY